MVVLRHTSGKYLCYYPWAKNCNDPIRDPWYWGLKRNAEQFYFDGERVKRVLTNLGPFVETRWI